MCALIRFSAFVIAVRVSGGHLCKAEAPTEPAGETAARRVAIRSSTFVIAKPRKRLWQSVSLLKGNTDSFALRVQNDKPVSYCKYIKCADKLSFTCHCGAGVRWTPLRSRSTDRAGRRDRRKACGNPFSFNENTDFFAHSAKYDKEQK